VIAIPNQNTLLGIDYQWSNGSTEDMVTLNEGETVSVTTTSTADNCARTSTYTLEKARAAIGGEYSCRTRFSRKRTGRRS